MKRQVIVFAALLLLAVTFIEGRFTLSADGGREIPHQPRLYEGAQIHQSRTLSSYLGGVGNEFAGSVGMDSNGNIYVAGSTSSVDFPLVHPLQSRKAGGLDVFLTKVSPGGQVLFSTYIGGVGADQLYDLAIDRKGSIILVGETGSSDFPLMHPLQSRRKGPNDAFVTIISTDGRRILFSTFLGGTSDDTAFGVDLDQIGNIYLAGATGSSNFPVENPFQSQLSDFEDAFVLKLAPDGKRILYSSYLGGRLGDAAYDLAVSNGGSAVITGVTDSHDFPIKQAFQPLTAGQQDTFVTKVSPTGALIFSTFLGGKLPDWGQGVALNKQNEIFLAGWTASNDFPLKKAFLSRKSGPFKSYVTKMASSGQSLIYSTYLGGTGSDTAYSVCVDQSGQAVVVGRTFSSDFPLVNGWQTYNLGLSNGDDAFISRLTPSGSGLSFSTYVGGGSGEIARKVFCGENNKILVVGSSGSSDFPVTNPFQGTKSGGFRTDDAFVVLSQ